MTDSERTVLEALKTIPLAPGDICYGDSVANDEHHRVLYSIAPRITAAIEAAAQVRTFDTKYKRQVALAVLRGEW